MKKVFLTASLAIALCFAFSCNDNTKTETGTHTHKDGATHADHDTVKPKQEEFIVADSTHKDSTGNEHTHGDGKKHSH